MGGTVYENAVVFSEDTEVLINPTFISSLGGNRRDYAITFKANVAQTNCYFLIRQDGVAIFESKRKDMVVGLNTFDVTTDQGFFDLTGGVSYEVVVLSEDGDVELLGGTTFPYLQVTYQEWEDVQQATLNDITVAATSPTFGAIHSTDSNIFFGGFKSTGVIRRRDTTTGVDTFYQSTASLPIPDEASWTDWQNRETLTYGVL